MARIKSDTNRAHTSRDIDKHIVGKAEAQMDGHKYDVQKGEVHSTTRLEDDDGSGRPIILRRFEYKYPPGPHQTPSKDEVLTPGYLKFLESTLYLVDNLELIEHPKVIFNTKGYSIFAVCQARKGHILPYDQTPQTLSQITNGPR